MPRRAEHEPHHEDPDHGAGGDAAPEEGAREDTDTWAPDGDGDSDLLVIIGQEDLDRIIAERVPVPQAEAVRRAIADSARMPRPTPDAASPAPPMARPAGPAVSRWRPLLGGGLGGLALAVGALVPLGAVWVERRVGEAVAEADLRRRQDLEAVRRELGETADEAARAAAARMEEALARERQVLEGRHREALEEAERGRAAQEEALREARDGQAASDQALEALRGELGRARSEVSSLAGETARAEALRGRVQALEAELAAREARISELERALEARQAPAPPADVGEASGPAGEASGAVPPAGPPRRECPACLSEVPALARECPICGTATTAEAPPADEGPPPDGPPTPARAAPPGGLAYVCPICGATTTLWSSRCDACGAVFEPEDEERGLWARWRVPEPARGWLAPRLHWTDRGYAADDQTQLLEAELGLTVPLGRRLKAVLDPHLVADEENLHRGVVRVPRDDALVAPAVDAREAYLRLSTGPLEVTAGKRVFAWGKADAFNPTDNLNPRDATDLLDLQRIGVPSAAAEYYLGDLVLEGVLVPAFTPTRLPPAGSRYAIDLSALPLPIRERDLPEVVAENAQVGARVSSYRGGWDLSASFYGGHDDLPTLALSEDLRGLTPFYARVFIFGGDFSTTLGAWELHGEAAELYSRDDDGDSYLQAVGGVNRRLESAVAGRDLVLILEYAGEVVTRRVDTSGDPTHIARALGNAVATRLTWEATDHLDARVAAVWEMDGEDAWWIQPELAWRAVDRVEVFLRGDLPGGGERTFFGRLRDERRAVAGLNLSF
ncbi:MAG: hypothetical protein HY722_06450 [Planctomycetes bacterium]|nr:hypothetical protein [Planctomycetota bacterium]